VQPASLLLIQPRWMGDVLLCTPAMRLVRAALPDARIDFLTEAAGAAVLADNPHIDDVIVAGDEGTAARMRVIRNRRYDAVVDFRSTGSTALVTLASGASFRVGVHGRGVRNLAYSHVLARERRPIYMARQKTAMLAPLGIRSDNDDHSLHIEIGDRQRERAAHVWQKHALDGHPVAAISAVSRIGYKQWGAPRWAAVADHLAARGMRILLSSGPGERGDAAATAALMRAPAVWEYGDSSIRDLAAMYQRCALWVGNDGGPKHVAAAAGIPTITVFRFPVGKVWTADSPPGAHTFLEPASAGSDVPVATVTAHIDARL
jgi:heptosyltransferase III